MPVVFGVGTVVPHDLGIFAPVPDLIPYAEIGDRAMERVETELSVMGPAVFVRCKFNLTLTGVVLTIRHNPKIPEFLLWPLFGAHRVISPSYSL
jgi:hypothetical protein